MASSWFNIGVLSCRAVGPGGWPEVGAARPAGRMSGRAGQAGPAGGGEEGEERRRRRVIGAG